MSCDASCERRGLAPGPGLRRRPGTRSRRQRIGSAASASGTLQVDTSDAKGLRTTAHSRLLLDNVAAEDAATTARLEAAGMVLIGKLATHEFATGGPAWDLPFPPARNPWNTDHFTGGSSSGSGAAVAAGILPLAMGSDTGGSIRLPAAYCGTVGLKPTYGRVSRRGVAPLCYTLDTTGPLTWTVEDAALSLQVLAGYDPRDPGSADVPVPNYT